MIYGPLNSKKQKIKKDAIKFAKNDIDSENKFCLGFEKGVDESFDLFASVVDSYKRYKDDVKLLMKEQRNVWKEWIDYYDSQSDIDVSSYLNRYDNWLFNYTFSNINGEKSENLFDF